LVDLVSTIGFGRGQHARDVLGEVYEYFLGKFAMAEGKGAGQYYTPAAVVKVLVEVLAPHKGKVYDPCCGSGGMFVQSEKFIESHGGRCRDEHRSPQQFVSEDCDLKAGDAKASPRET
jgi:type I restriction enzyme M protein